MDIKYLITVDAQGAVKSVQDFDNTIDKLGKTSNKTDGVFGGLWKQFTIGALVTDGLRKGFGLLKDFIEGSIKAAMEAEKADKALEGALIATGRPVAELTRHFKDYSSELQKNTTYDDEAIKRTQALLVQLTNLDEKGLDQATRGAIGLASVMGIDLDSAATVVAKSMAGNTSLLARYGIHVRETGTAEEKRADALNKLSGFYQRAEKDTETYAGKLTQLKNNYNDIQEAVGKLITQNSALMNSLNSAAEGILYLANADEMLAGKDAILREQQNRQVEWLSKAAVAAGWHYGAMSKLIEAYHGNVTALVMAINKDKEGVEIKKALNAVVKEAHGIWDKEAAARNRAERGTNSGIETDKKAIEEKKKLADAARDIIGEYQPLHAAMQKVFEKQLVLTKALGAGAITAAEYKKGMDGAEKELRSFGSTLVSTTIPAARNMQAIFEKAASKMQDSAYKTKKSWIDSTSEWIIANQEKILQYSGVVSGVVSQIDAILRQSTNNKLIRLDKEYQAQLENIKKSEMSEKEKQEAITALESEYGMKRKELQRKAAEQGKAIALVQAIINVAEGVTKALGALPPPFNIALAAITAALGAIQIAMIRAQPIPLAQGAIFQRPATLISARTGQQYEVAEAGEAEIVSSPRRLREAIFGRGQDRGGTMNISIPIYLGMEKIDERILRIADGRVEWLHSQYQRGNRMIPARAVGGA